MSDMEHRLRVIAAHEVAAYRRRGAVQSPDARAMVRKILGVGSAGYRLGLDTVPGVVWARLSDHGADGVHMPPGCAYLEVWGGRPHEVFATVERERPMGLLLVTRWHPATWWVRLKAWARWTLYRVAGKRAIR